MRLIRLAATVALCSIAIPAFAQPSPEEIIAQGDKNGDKALDKAEWDAMGAPIPYPDEADTNHDGKIDVAELRAYMNQMMGGAPPGGNAPSGIPPSSAPATPVPAAPPAH